MLRRALTPAEPMAPQFLFVLEAALHLYWMVEPVAHPCARVPWPPIFIGLVTMKLELSLPPKHASCLLHPTAKHKILVGGRAAGKSTGAADYCIGRAVEKKRKIVGARQFQRSIEHSSKSLIENRIEALGLRDQFWITEQSIRHVNGSEFAFIGLERNLDSIRSMDAVDIWWVEEARNVSQKVLDVLLPTMRKLNCEAIWTYNPVERTDPIDVYFRGSKSRRRRTRCVTASGGCRVSTSWSARNAKTPTRNCANIRGRPIA
jgi:hypothetical protein